MNEILNFINENDNWEHLLSNEPYNLMIKHDGPYVLVKYNHIQTDFSNPIHQQARGSIFYYDIIDQKWKYACRPYDKFGNYGVDYAATYKLDWNNAYVREKVDGSLIKVWFSPIENLWWVSTNGTIDAAQATMDEGQKSFYDYFIHALGGRNNFNILLSKLNIYYTYMFELVGPENKIIVDYDEPAVYLLAARHNVNGCIINQLNYEPLTCFNNFDFIKHPKIYPLNSLEECIAATDQMGADQEGFVVNDTHGNMIKVKSAEYLIASRCANNGVPLSVKTIIDFIDDNKIDDVVDYAPAFQQEKIRKVQLCIDWMCYNMEKWGTAIKCATPKQQYEGLVNLMKHSTFDDTFNSMIVAFGIAYYKGQANKPYKFLFKNKTKLAHYIKWHLNYKEEDGE